MQKIKIFDAGNRLSKTEKREVVDFLHENLEQYGDSKADITKAIDYSLQEYDSDGGFTMVIQDDEKIRGAVVINRTGMSGYIPENILVYIATDKNCRGEGLGKKLLRDAIDHTQGDIALHVDADNEGARMLYQKFGFQTPYLEMRLKR